METLTRSFRNHFGELCRCPRCGTLRVTKLKERDKIDKMETGIFNMVERLLGGKLYHCRFCRVQFFDRRDVGSAPTESAPPPVANEPAHAPMV